jgi:hypothetical protein
MALVIKNWNASDKPDENGEYVRIQGRESGLFSFLLALVGIDPTTTLRIDAESVRRDQGSLSGSDRSVTPLKRVATASYGYSKPWKPAAVMIVFGMLAMSIPLIGWLIGLLLLLWAPLYYVLNRQLFVRIGDTGGNWTGIEFKRSVIEGKNIDEAAGERIVRIIEMLLLERDHPRPLVVAAHNMPSVALELAGAQLDAVAERARERVEATAAQAARVTEKVAARLRTSSTMTDSNRHASAATQLEGRCSSCGAGLNAGDSFCPSCGGRL